MDLVVGEAGGAFNGPGRQEQPPDHHGEQQAGQRGSGDGAHQHANRKEAAVEQEDVGQGVEDFEFPHPKGHAHGEQHAQANQGHRDGCEQQTGHELGHEDARSPPGFGQQHVDSAPRKKIREH